MSSSGIDKNIVRAMDLGSESDGCLRIIYVNHKTLTNKQAIKNYYLLIIFGWVCTVFVIFPKSQITLFKNSGSITQ